MIPSEDLELIQGWVDTRNAALPERAVGLIEYQLDVTNRHATIMECRPPWRPEYGPEWTRFPIARLRYTATRGEWSLYWRDRNLRFHLYRDVEPTDDVTVLLAEVTADPTAIFFG